MIDPLFGKYCYIDTPWIAGKHTIYRIIRSGVKSTSWCEVPVNGRTKKVNHGEHSEEIVFVMLDTLIDEDTKIMRFALKDVEIIEMADRKTEPSDSEKPNDCDTCIWSVCNYNKAFEDEPQTDCLTCKHSHDKWYHPYCDSCSKAHSNYEPKTEPQTERSE